jgi:hypothetical protein
MGGCRRRREQRSDVDADGPALRYSNFLGVSNRRPDLIGETAFVKQGGTDQARGRNAGDNSQQDDHHDQFDKREPA